MTPSSLNAGLSVAIFSMVVPRRMPSSLSTGLPSWSLIATIWSSNAPESCAAAAFSWEPSENSSTCRAVEAPLLGDHLGADALVRGPLVAVLEALRVRVAAVGQRRPHRGARHRLDTTGDDGVVMPGHHTGGGEVDRLLARTALAVDGHTRDALRPAGGQQRGAADVERLLAGLHDAAPDHVVDDAGVDAGALGKPVEDLRRKFGRVHTRKPAVALADR